MTDSNQEYLSDLKERAQEFGEKQEEKVEFFQSFWEKVETPKTKKERGPRGQSILAEPEWVDPPERKGSATASSRKLKSIAGRTFNEWAEYAGQRPGNWLRISSSASWSSRTLEKLKEEGLVIRQSTLEPRGLFIKKPGL